AVSARHCSIALDQLCKLCIAPTRCLVGARRNSPESLQHKRGKALALLRVMNATSQIVAAAIARSIAHNEIVHLDDVGNIRELLFDECEDYVEGDDEVEYWGVNLDGETWRVHV